MDGGRRPGIVIAVILLAVVLSPIIYSAVANTAFKKAAAPKLTLPKEGGQCVRDTEWMRANHMKLLWHTRKDVVREGVRKTSETLSNCSTCHTKREEFCDSCHQYAGVKPKCFECHFAP